MADHRNIPYTDAEQLRIDNALKTTRSLRDAGLALRTGSPPLHVPRTTLWSRLRTLGIRSTAPLTPPPPPTPAVTYTTAQLRKARAEADELRCELGRLLAFRTQLDAAIQALPPLPKKSILLPKEPLTSTPVAAVLLLSDWHIGETISAAETANLNQYNDSIAAARLQYLGRKFLAWVNAMRHCYRITDLHVLMLGDFISGNIHDELRTTAEFPVPVQIVNAAHHASVLIGGLAPSFASTRIHAVEPDNHARLSLKVESKLRGNTYNYVLYELLSAYLAHTPDIHITRYPSTSAIATIHHNSILLDHGHSVRSWMGIPYYGMEREEGRAARLHMRKGARFDLHIRGHWHYAALGPFGIVNGSLSGPSEYDLRSNRDAPPSQVSFLLHPDHGFFNWTAWNLYPATREAPRRRGNRPPTKPKPQLDT